MASRSALLTVLFTDIVGSTGIADELGNARWRELLTRHHGIIRRELRRFGGREIDTAGDGFFAIFDRPTQAIRCAAAACAGVRELGIELRAGIHFGEVERTREGASGVAVHLGARIGAAAGPGEVLVSDTVRQLARGTGVVLEDRGTHALKGVPESQALFSVSEVDGKPLAPPLLGEEAAARRGALGPAPDGRRRRAALLGTAVLAVVAAVVVVTIARRNSPAPPVSAPMVGVLVRIDPETNAPVERFDGLVSRNLGHTTPTVEAGEGGVWVLSGQNDVRHLDPSTGVVTPIEVGGSVSEIALGHGRLWVTAGGLLEVSPGGLSVGEEHELDKPIAHRDFLVTMTDDAVWTSSQGSLTRIDPITGEQRTVAAGTPEDDMVGVGDDLWLADRFGDRLARFDTKSSEIVETISLQTNPDQLAAGNGRAVWILDEFGETVTPVSPSGQLGRAIPTGDRPLALAVGEDAVWVGSSDGTLRRIDPVVDAEIAVIQMGGPIQAIDVDPETGDVWVYLAAGSEFGGGFG